RLFALCGSAQGIAARCAVAAAQGEFPAPDTLARERQALLREVVGEHLWRLCLDWPARFGLPPRTTDFAIWRRRLLAGDALPREALPAWEDFAVAAERLPRCPAPPLPLLLPMAVAAWAEALAQACPALADGWTNGAWEALARFAAAPALMDGPRETGVLARWQGDPLVAGLWAEGRRPAARLAARCLDLAALAPSLEDDACPAAWIDAVPLGPDIGLARVETARGPLLHLVQVREGRVAHYVMVAPTEWNFHPAGPFVRDLTGLAADSRDAAERLAREVALSLDPCVTLEFS
ncbi:MAG: nickel-dependent hydrogenase large subunit, partial [Betaproteobacteria bacterium]|nr:nickel-dependent hydrogenase large subunit [Betaproteobacteria bacterium]